MHLGGHEMKYIVRIAAIGIAYRPESHRRKPRERRTPIPVCYPCPAKDDYRASCVKHETAVAEKAMAALL
jgi:hypothetical protein